MPEIREAVTGGRAWSPHYTYVPALRVGNMVWLSGTTGTDDNGKITAPGDIVEQTRQIFRKFEKLLTSIGGTCDDIVETHDFFTTTENYKGTAAVRREFFKTSCPAATGVQVSGLLRKDALIEISAMAVLRGASSWMAADMDTGKISRSASVIQRLRGRSRRSHLQFCKLVGYDVPLFPTKPTRRLRHTAGASVQAICTMSFSTAMTGRLFANTVLGLLAVERGKLLKPVRPGDTIRTEVEVIEKKPSAEPRAASSCFAITSSTRIDELVFQLDKITLLNGGRSESPCNDRLTRQPLETIERHQNAKLRFMLALCARGHPYYRGHGRRRDRHQPHRNPGRARTLPLTPKTALMADPESFRLRLD